MKIKAVYIQLNPSKKFALTAEKISEYFALTHTHTHIYTEFSTKN